jgi:hypothetical protein
MEIGLHPVGPSPSPPMSCATMVIFQSSRETKKVFISRITVNDFLPAPRKIFFQIAGREIKINRYKFFITANYLIHSCYMVATT